MSNQNTQFKPIQAMTTVIKTSNLEIQQVGNKSITIQNTEWGWFVQVSDGYTSDYFTSKKQAIERLSEIKQEIKNDTW